MSIPMAGYSGTPLPKKLGIKEGHRIALINAPKNFANILGALPNEVELSHRVGNTLHDVLLYFVTEQATLEKEFTHIAKHLKYNGGFWVAWPKRASGVATDVTENTVRDVALAAGLVDNKVCAIDEVWSGLRCVVRVKDRPVSRKQDVVMPGSFIRALSKSPKAKAVFDAMPPSHQKEWVGYIAEAKRDETREKRAQQAVRRLLENKS